MRVIATAGHVDHGKSTLVEALTGIDPDRWAEEKERGLTIDLGFAWCSLPSGREIAFVDVPGHIRFLKNMIAGVGAVDACLFVVAATEGWKPQSEEHMRILELVGVERGVVALTKTGLVDDDTRELRRLEIGERTAGTFLARSEIVAVDAPSGDGLDNLRRALDSLVVQTQPSADKHRPRLWVDRSFAARGAGTVVTGTLTGGAVAIDDEMVVLPAGSRARVRGLQSHSSSLTEAGPGRRLAINLAGVSHSGIERGNAIVRAPQWSPTLTFDASLSVLASLGHEVRRRGAYVAYVGTGEYTVRLRVLGGRDALEPASVGAVRIHLPVPLPLLPGDRFVLRESGREETIGGGEVLDVDPVLPPRRAEPTKSIDRVVAERQWVDADLLERLTGERRAPSIGRWVVDPDVLARKRDELSELIRAAGADGVDVAALDERERSVVASLDDVKIDGGRAKSSQQELTDPVDHPYIAALEASLFSPPSPEEAGVPRADVRDLVRRGLVIERDGFYFAPKAIDRARVAISELLMQDRAEGLTVAQIRDSLGTTRKYLLPLLAHLDATGVTRRRGDLRIPGPRL